MKRKIITAIALLFSLLASSSALGSEGSAQTADKSNGGNQKKYTSLAQAAGLEDIPDISSESGIIMDAKSQAVLFAKNANKKQYPASITKVMTVLLALENGNPDDVITCSKNAIWSIESGSSHIGIKPDEQLVLRDALNGILLKSANEVSNAVAEYVAGDMDSFAELMTARAKELGCKNTNFVNANGLHNDEHYTTAYDMALILKEAMKHPLFREIVMTRQAYIPFTNLTEEKRYLGNSNQMILKNSKYYYDKCTGGKTGFTRAALHTLVNSATDGELSLISAMLRSQAKPDKWNDTKDAFEYCFEHFYNIKLSDSEGDPSFAALKAIQIKNGAQIDSASVLSYVDPEASITLPNDATFDDVTTEAKQLELTETERLIQVKYFYNGFLVGKAEVSEKLPQKAVAAGQSTDMPQNATKAVAEAAKGNTALMIFLIIAAVAAAGGAVAFIIIKKKRNTGYYMFDRRELRRNKYSFDKSLFKRR